MPCNTLCTECFGSGSDQCFECVNVFVANGSMLAGRLIVECLFACPEGFDLSSATLQCLQGAPPTVSG